jgi:ketosteroid isomerase-like protein
MMMTTNTPTATIEQIANDLVALCRQGKHDEAMIRYYADDAVKIEAMPCGNAPARTEGKDALLKASKEWSEAREIHACTIGDPIYSSSEFAITMSLDCTEKASGQRTQEDEIAVYSVKDGKIKTVRFFYGGEAG